MSELYFWASDFLSDQGYMPHGMCLLWRPEVFWAHALSDTIIALSYFSIPLALGTFALRRRDLEYPWILSLFVAFVAACGVTHLFGVWTLWVPEYGWEALAKIVTAFVSAATAVALWPLIPKALAVPGRVELERRNMILAKEVARRQEAERQLRELNRNLEAIVAERTQGLTQANARLSEAIRAAEAANQAKTRFLAVMSHEVRTPLNAIIGMNRLLEGSVAGERERRWLKAIGSAGELLLGILNDVLDLSKIESGRLELSEGDFSVETAIDDVVTLFGDQAQRKGLVLTASTADNVPPIVHGDAVRFRQILYNLVSNAVKFTGSGEVHIAVRCQTEDSREWLVTEVRDSGCGVGQEQLERIFESFVQADGSVARRHGGTGLGLAICRQLVELMGGRIDVDSTPGIGSTFRFRIPCIPGAANESAPRTTERAAAHQRSLRLLVAEDVPYNQMLMEEILVASGHLPIFASNGWEVLTALEAEDFDAILMDVFMPDMDGLEATKRIRGLEDPNRRRIPIIGLTAAVMDSQVQDCLAAGMNACLPKPLRPDVLEETLIMLTADRPSNDRDIRRAAAPEEPDPDPILDEEMVQDMEARLGRATVSVLYEGLVHHCLPWVEGLRARTEDAHRVGHALAGMTGNMGALRLSRMAAALAERASGPLDVRGEADRLNQALDELDAAIRRRFSGSAPSGRTLPDENGEPAGGEP